MNKDNINSKSYNEFIKNNPGTGYLKIRAYAANGAIPVRGLNIVISNYIDGSNVIFFEGSTNESGVIDKISLPAPIINSNDLVIPNYITYDLRAYIDNKVDKLYKVNIFDGVSVIQNISISPLGSEYGS